MSHDFEPEPHEKAMIDVILKRNTTPEWVYKFNKFLIDERTTGEIIKFTDELLHQELQKAREERDTYWKERVRKEVEGLQERFGDWDNGDENEPLLLKCEVLGILDNLK